MPTKKPQFNLSGFKYVPRLFMFESVSSFGLISPIRRDIAGLWSRSKSATLKELGNAIGMTLENHEKALAAHQKRFTTYSIISQLVSWVIYILLAITTLFIVTAAFFLSGLFSIESNIVTAFFMVLYVLSVFMALQIANRLTSTIIDGYYADTLCFVTSLYLLLEIHQEDALLLPTQRNISLKRARALKRIIALLSYQYTSAASTPNKLAQDAFKKLEYFVEEKEYQILAPTARTRSVLEKELLSLVEILLTSHYGEFKYSRKHVKNTEVLASRSNRMIRGATRVIGFVLPIIILIGLIIYPNQFKIIEPYNNIVALVSFAWLLLAIDANLNLGVVDRVAGLARTIKELR